MTTGEDTYAILKFQIRDTLRVSAKCSVGYGAGRCDPHLAALLWSCGTPTSDEFKPRQSGDEHSVVKMQHTLYRGNVCDVRAEGSGNGNNMLARNEFPRR